MTYNAEDKRVADENFGGQITATAWDGSHLVAVTNALGNATIYEYDLRGLKTYEGGATYPVRYTYDIFGNKTTMTTYRNESLGPNSGDVTTWLYDIASGSMTNKVYADGKGPTYAYTPDGKLSRRTWARGIVTDYFYDGWGNLTNTVYSDNTPTISLAYDALGRQSEAHDAAGVTTFLYDSFGSLTNETVIGVVGTNTIIRHWDGYGRTIGYALNGARQTTIGYEPDKGRIATMEIADNHSTTTTNHYNAFSWTYLPGSDLKSSLAYPNGLTASWTYDANNQLLQVCNAFPTNVISQYDYIYDSAVRRVAIARSGSAMSENRVDEYGYNIRGELISATKNAEGAKVLEYQYQYDDIGNRFTSFDLGTNRTYTANNLNQYTSISNSASFASSAAIFTPQFDDDGNQTLIKTAIGIWQVHYNGENRPVQWQCVSTNSSTSPLISMSYDRMGRRVTKNAQRFVYDGYLQIADNNGNEYVWDPTEKVATRPLVWSLSHIEPFNFSTSFYTHDGNKNVSEVIVSNSTVVAHYEYAPFGIVIGLCDEYPPTSRLRFSSEYADDELSLVYYNYRHYNLSDGRWVARDRIGEAISQDLYLFVNNSPFAKYDFLGDLLITGWPLIDWWQGSNCRKAGGIYANGRCCCSGQEFWPGTKCCRDNKVIDDSEVVSAVRHKVQSYSSSEINPDHIWLTWGSESVDSNGLSDGIIHYPAINVIDITTRFDLSDLSRNITLSTCGYSIEKFHACLSREAKEGNGKYGGMCYSYVDGLVDKCKKEAKYE